MARTSKVPGSRGGGKALSLPNRVGTPGAMVSLTICRPAFNHRQPEFLDFRRSLDAPAYQHESDERKQLNTDLSCELQLAVSTCVASFVMFRFAGFSRGRHL